MPTVGDKDFGPEPLIPRIQKRMAKGQTLEEAAEGLKIPFWLARAVFVRSGLPVPRPQRRRPTPNGEAQKAFEPMATLLALRLLSHELGAQASSRGPMPVSMATWDAHRDPAQHPKAAALITLYGTWGAACTAAGVPLRKRRA